MYGDLIYVPSGDYVGRVRDVVPNTGEIGWDHTVDVACILLHHKIFWDREGRGDLLKELISDSDGIASHSVGIIRQHGMLFN